METRVQFYSTGEYRSFLQDEHVLVGLNKGKDEIYVCMDEKTEETFGIYEIPKMTRDKMEKLRAGKTPKAKKFLRVYPAGAQDPEDDREFYVGVEDKPIALFILLGVLAVLLIVLGFMFLGPKTDAPVDVGQSSKPAFDLTLDEGAEEGGWESKTPEEIQEALNAKVEAGMINISMNLNPVFANGTSEGNLMIVNEEINNYPQVVEIFLEGSDEPIYTSGLIPVGSRISSAKLDKDLDKGKYDCIAYFNAVNPETGDVVGKAAAEIIIYIQE